MKKNFLIRNKLFVKNDPILHIRSKTLDCKRIANEILHVSNKELTLLKVKPKISVILPVDSNGESKFDSRVYVRNKVKKLTNMGIDVNVLEKKFNNISHIYELIENLNRDVTNNGTLIQLPVPDCKINIKILLDTIKPEKDIDSLNSNTIYKLYDQNWKGIKPTVCLGICALFSRYQIKTLNKNIVILGDGLLVGKPLGIMLRNYPYDGNVTNCSLSTKNLKEITRQADILISACGQPHFVRPDFIKEGAIVIDVGINSSYSEKDKKLKLIGDVCPTTYDKCKFYTPVPGGIGLLTVSALTFNILNAIRLQNKLNPLDLIQKIREYYVRV